MFEIFWQYFFRKSVLIQDDEADSIGTPSDNIMILLILNKSNGYIEKFVGLF